MRGFCQSKLEAPGGQEDFGFSRFNVLPQRHFITIHSINNPISRCEGGFRIIIFPSGKGGKKIR